MMNLMIMEKCVIEMVCRCVAPGCRAGYSSKEMRHQKNKMSMKSILARLSFRIKIVAQKEETNGSLEFLDSIGQQLLTRDFTKNTFFNNTTLKMNNKTRHVDVKIRGKLTWNILKPEVIPLVLGQIFLATLPKLLLLARQKPRAIHENHLYLRGKQKDERLIRSIR